LRIQHDDRDFHLIASLTAERKKSTAGSSPLILCSLNRPPLAEAGNTAERTSPVPRSAQRQRDRVGPDFIDAFEPFAVGVAPRCNFDNASNIHDRDIG